MYNVNIRETTTQLNIDDDLNQLFFFNSSEQLNIDDDLNQLFFFNSSNQLNVELRDFDGQVPEFKVILDFYIYTLGDIF